MEELRAAIFPIKYRLRLFAGGRDRSMIASCDRVSATHDGTRARYGIWNILSAALSGVWRYQLRIQPAVLNGCHAIHLVIRHSTTTASTAATLIGDSPFFLSSGVTSGNNEDGLKFGKGSTVLCHCLSSQNALLIVTLHFVMTFQNV